MSEFPSVEAHELVTKDFLRAELESLRSELGSEIASVRSELREGLASLEAKLTVRVGGAVAASTALLASINLVA